MQRKRTVALGLIRAYVFEATNGNRPDLITSKYVTVSISTLAQVVETDKHTTTERLRILAAECANAIFDTEVWDGQQMAYRIEKKYGWRRGTINRFIFGEPRKIAA